MSRDERPAESRKFPGEPTARPQPVSVASLVESAASGDQQASESLVDRFAPLIRHRRSFGRNVTGRFGMVWRELKPEQASSAARIAVAVACRTAAELPGDRPTTWHADRQHRSHACALPGAASTNLRAPTGGGQLMSGNFCSDLAVTPPGDGGLKDRQSTFRGFLRVFRQNAFRRGDGALRRE